jgi:hypothetical protein
MRTYNGAIHRTEASQENRQVQNFFGYGGVVAYDIHCSECGHTTWAGNIDELLKVNTCETGQFVCGECQSRRTSIFRSSDLQEGNGEKWDRWIKGVIQIDSGISTYRPYIFLTADSSEGEVNGLHFHYYKDTRGMPGGRLKHGHGPGGPPVLAFDHLSDIIKHLVNQGLMSKTKLADFVAKLDQQKEKHA